ncbi:hypothetical protein [Rhizobium ruizarguesonis]|uniref:hypothetical protein n=1 Tax=Rhizobium ruizarguesonis TaxID=2081791 RepID=UPI00102FAD95|nr:hypothetical protein [Rhizobium ruizarguesonis]TAT71053.1 hypothetical protein ELI52_36415 [Rhizobium ruizarguesonis]
MKRATTNVLVQALTWRLRELRIRVGIAEIEQAMDLALVLLGPPKQKLADLCPEWEAAVRGLYIPPVLAARPKVIPTVKNLRDLATREDMPGRTRPNGASIAFVLEVGQAEEKKRVPGCDRTIKRVPLSAAI